MPSLKEIFRNLNVFEPDPGSGEIEDEPQRRFNIIVTRIYLTVLILVLIALALFLWLSSQTTIATLQHPTKEQIKVLPADAQCPCSHISIPHGQFISFQPIFHQLCSSDFVSSEWIKAIFNGSNPTYFYIADFRISGSSQFQTLASFCSLSKASVLDSIASFDLDALTSPQVLSEAFVQLQVNTSIEQFQSAARKTFESQLQLVRELTMAHQLLTGLQTNFIPIYFRWEDEPLNIYLPKLDLNFVPENANYICDCRQTLDCQFPSAIYNLFGRRQSMGVGDHVTNISMSIRGISVGCLPVDSILASTLECFYNQTCVNELISLLSPMKMFTAMNSTKKSQYNPNSTVKLIVDRLMVEEWVSNIEYEKYYNQCAPIACTYFIKERHGFIFILTKIIGLLASLTTALKIIIPYVIRFIKRPRNVEPAPRIPCKCNAVQLMLHLTYLDTFGYAVVIMRLFIN